MVFTFPLFAFMQNSWKTITKQEALDALKKTSEWYKTMNAYSVDVIHTSYIAGNTTPFETSKGFFKKKGNSYHSYMLGVRSVQNEKFLLVIDTASKTIMIDNPKELKAGLETPQGTAYEKYYEKFLQLKSTNGTSLKFTFKKGGLLDYYEMKINKDGSPSEIIMLYAQEQLVEEGNTTKAKPRLKIGFSNYKKNINIDAKEFDHAKYISVSGEKISAAGIYKNYKIADVRIKE